MAIFDRDRVGYIFVLKMGWEAAQKLPWQNDVMMFVTGPHGFVYVYC